MKDHRGQIAFPGGVKDAGDPNLLATALRETQEEIGLEPEAVEVLGALPPVATITGYHITPFVGLIPHPYDFRPNPLEVKRLLLLPLADFYPAERWSCGHYRYQGQHHPGLLLALEPGSDLGRHRPDSSEPPGPSGPASHTWRPRCHLSGLTWPRPRPW